MSNEMIELVLADAAERMDKAVARVRQEFSTVRTGRPNPAILDRVVVEYYGSEVPLKQLASFSVPEAQLMVIAPFDKTSMEAIERAIQLADLGLNPSNDGTVMRLNFPPLTEERRKEFVKVVKGMAEEGRVAVRNLRRSANKEIDGVEKDGDVSSDDSKRATESVDQLTRAHEDQINDALAHKEEELLAV